MFGGRFTDAELDLHVHNDSLEGSGAGGFERIDAHRITGADRVAGTLKGRFDLAGSIPGLFNTGFIVDTASEDEPSDLRVFINPEIVTLEGKAVWEEGCLSFPGVHEEIERAAKVTVRATNERGEHNTIVNAPLRPGDGGEAFRAAFETVILPRLRDFRPDLIVISAGFDAHMRDPLANLNLLETDFDWATRKLMEVADASANGRVLSVLEGGYDLEGLANSVAAHVAALMQG